MLEKAQLSYLLALGKDWYVLYKAFFYYSIVKAVQGCDDNW